MTLQARLQSTLNATAALDTPGHNGPDLGLLLETINRTVLPRTLELRRDGGKTIRLEVRNRRLYRLVCDGKCGDPWDMDLNSEDRDAAANALRAAFLESNWSDLTTQKVSGGANSASLGIAAPSLLERLLPSSDGDKDPDTQTKIAVFDRKLPGTVEAGYAMEGDAIAPVSGAPDRLEHWLPRVSDLFVRITSEDGALSGTLETEGTMILPRDDVETGCILIHGRTGSYSALILNGITPGEALANWNAI